MDRPPFGLGKLDPLFVRFRPFLDDVNNAGLRLVDVVFWECDSRSFFNGIQLKHQLGSGGLHGLEVFEKEQGNGLPEMIRSRPLGD